MRVVVAGGTGRVGAQLVAMLRAGGHDAVPLARSTGADLQTGAGVDAALTGADVVVDVTRPSTYVDAEVLAFFTTGTRTLLDAGARAGVRHHLVLSIVGVDHVDAGFYRAKRAQEDLVRASDVAWSVVRATQFFEFVGTIADHLTVDGVVRVPPVAFQPVATADVASALADVATGEPLREVVDLAGPERVRFDAFLRDVLAARGDGREVVTDPEARYFGARLVQGSLVPHGEALHGGTSFARFAARAANPRQAQG
ncbi:SDR family oxidoreductase [Cellulosimicrobium sp. NPDC055967]|uniref:SDR family oxidoreductase n=1 Tax=Cellulosimicrobium sp. NPDC055967 TaxID=3345670 RepID=UPI0035D68D70